MPSVFTLEGPDLSTLGTMQMAGGGVISSSGNNMSIMPYDSSVANMARTRNGFGVSGNNMDVIFYPEWGSPISTANGSPIGPARIEPPVYGPGGTPQMYRRQYPARGPVCDYCDPNEYAVLGDPIDTLNDKPSSFMTAVVIAGTIAAGAALGGLGIWMFNKSGHRSAGKLLAK